MTDPASGRDPSPKAMSNFALRILAALVMAPLALLLAYLGGWPWALLCILAGLGIFAEWVRIVGRRPLWIAAGLVYGLAPVISAIVLRADPATGFAALVFVLLIVWASDTFGYFAGRAIGGPKLWPRVSPKKTWAGAIGGLIGAAVIGACFGFAGYRAAPLAALAAILAVAAQGGDLLESAVKRRFGVKDSSHLIPGHGGLMDRLDALVAALLFAALIGAARSGNTGSVGGGLMLW